MLNSYQDPGGRWYFQFNGLFQSKTTITRRALQQIYEDREIAW